MNKDEKRALICFITLYTLSSLFLMGIIGLLYYGKEKNGQHRVCYKQLNEVIMEVEIALMRAELNGETYVFQPNNYHLRLGLLDKDKKIIASDLKFQNIDFQEHYSVSDKRSQYLKKLPQTIQNVAYIVAEDASMPINIKELKWLIFLTIFFSMIFVAFIGYWLSRILLRPVHEKIEHIDKFIKDSAHEINTPVTALLMSVSALRKKGVAEEKLLRHISISSKQISDIYNSLSHVAFGDIKKMQKITTFDLKKEVLKSVAFYKEIADAKQIKIESVLDSLYVTIDRDSAGKLINNLISNAIKYSYNGKTVYIRLQNDKFSVKDEGMGISEEDRQKILTRYKRATNSVGGFGIGLDIVNTICKHYNIGFTIDSKIGKGSTFTLDFSNLIKCDKYINK